MADVRLTATNPEDSSVVPVACDAAGRLLLEEPQVIEGPPGPPGEQGPPGQDGDPFSGNFADDVTFGGSAEFAGTINISNYVGTVDRNPGVSLRKEGIIQVSKEFTDTPALLVGGYQTGVQNAQFALNNDGSAKFAGRIDGGGYDATAESAGYTLVDSGTILAKKAAGIGGLALGVRQGTVDRFAVAGNGQVNIDDDKIVLKADGSATFAGGKAGFTAEGYLWCTTERGDTVMLQATVGGAGLWIDYTPTTRLEEIRDKLDAYRGDTGEMPTDTQ